MAELRRTIDEIRFVLQDEAFSITDQLMQCIADYSLQCHEANVRLRKCEEFLNQGLRSEALHLAEISPNLLDLVALLDFPEREQWVNLLAGYSLPKPEPLLLGVAAYLTEAYAIQQPLQRLLDQHRLHALARSPLTQRLSVLRAIAQIDTASTHWEDDVRAMERARFREIETESRLAIAAGEVDELKSLVAELNSRVWLETVPPDLIRDVKQKGGHVVRGQAREQLEMLVETLHDAQAALNLPLARQMRDAWIANAKVVQLDEDEDLALEAAPILEWIADEDRKEAAELAYRRAVLDLEQALDDNTHGVIELQQLGLAIEKCGRVIPEALRTRYRNRLSSLELSESRRNLAKIAGTVGAVVVVVAIICVAVYFGNEAEKSKQVVAAVNGLIDELKLDEAQKLIGEHPERLLSEEGLKVKSKLATAMQTEQDRRANFNAALERARNTTDLAATSVALEQARSFVRTADDKIAVTKLESDWTTRRDADVAKTEQQFRTTLTSVTTKLRTLDGLLHAPDSETEIRKLVDQVQAELNELHSAESKVAPELTSQATLLESRFGGFRKTYADVLKKNVLLDRLLVLMQVSPTANPNDSQLTEYGDALAQFAMAFPNDPRVAGFKGAGSVEIIKSVLARQKLATSWQQLWPPDRVEVAPREKQCAAYVTEHANSPDREIVGRYQAFLKSLNWRREGDEDSEKPVHDRLKSVFSGKLIKDGYYLRTRDDKEYYLEKEDNFTERSLPFTFKYVVGFNGEVKTSKQMEKDQFREAKTSDPPQKALADDVTKTAPDVPLGEWDEYLHQLAIKILEAKDVNFFLRYFLLLRTLEYASQGNSLLAVELKKPLSDLNDNPPDMSVSWMDPTNSAARDSHERAKTLVNRISKGTLDDAWKRCLAAEDKLSAELFRQTLPVGWLERTSDRRWILRSKWKSEKKHSLLVSVAAEDGARSWQQVGTVQAGTTDWNIPVIGGLSEGTVVFATAVPAKAN